MDNITGTKLPGGLVGWLEGNKYIVANELDADDTAFGDSLKEAEATYWQRKIEKTETDLVTATRNAMELAARVSEEKKKWELANAELLLDNSDAKLNLDVTEHDVKQAGERLFDIFGNKEPGEFVVIKEKDGGLTYSDANAIAWCRENMKAAIMEVLDRKAFESYSKVGELDFVTVGAKIPTAQIARKKLDEAVNK